MNAIRVIEPYRHAGMWVFDDPAVNLRKEPFVGGADDLCEALATVKGVPHDRFTLVFSDEEFPGYQLHLKLKSVDKVGQTYKTDDGKEAWLCPALLKYFLAPPKHLYAQAKYQVKYAAKRPAHPWQTYHQFSPSRRG